MSASGTMRALVAAPGEPGGVALREVPRPEAAAAEAVVAVHAVSLNRGEVNRALGAEDGWRPGWDVAGEVVARAADGSGPGAGTRVVGLAAGGGWAEQVAVPTSTLAPIPDDLSYAAASTLPVAGLTALHALGVGHMHDDSRVLVTGAAGGVGRFAVQLASHAGTDVTAVVGHESRGEGLSGLGAARVVVGLPEEGAYDIVLESVGGASLAAAVRLVAPGGTVVSYGNSSGEPTTFSAADLYRKGGARLYGLILFWELAHTGSGTADLTHLAQLAASGRLDVSVDLERSWQQAGEALRALMDRRVAGKAVLLVD